MVGINEDLLGYQSSDSSAYGMFDCWYCSKETSMFVVRMVQPRAGQPDVAWLRCLSCRRGCVLNEGTILSPAASSLDVPMGIEGAALEAWNEVRNCLSVGAYTAAVMMCRKLLYHMAVEEGL